MSAKSIPNRLLVQSFTDLLNERKLIKSQPELEALAKKYDIDLAILQRVSKYVNSPSIGATLPSRNLNADGDEIVLMKVRIIF